MTLPTLMIIMLIMMMRFNKPGRLARPTGQNSGHWPGWKRGSNQRTNQPTNQATSPSTLLIKVQQQQQQPHRTSGEIYYDDVVCIKQQQQQQQHEQSTIRKIYYRCGIEQFDFGFTFEYGFDCGSNYGYYQKLLYTPNKRKGRQLHSLVKKTTNKNIKKKTMAMQL